MRRVLTSQASVGGQWVPVPRLAGVHGESRARGHDDDEGDTALTFLAAQIRLFANLCRDRNMAAVDTLSEHFLNAADTLACMQDARLPHSVRTALVWYFLCAFVDVDPNVDVLSETSRAFAWADLCANPSEEAIKDRTLSLGNVRCVLFPPVCAWVLATLRAVRGLDTSDRPRNMFLEAVLTLCKTFVDFGYYGAPPDIEDLVAELRVLLDGTRDTPSAALEPGSIARVEWLKDER